MYRPRNARSVTSEAFGFATLLEEMTGQPLALLYHSEELHPLIKECVAHYDECSQPKLSDRFVVNVREPLDRLQQLMCLTAFGVRGDRRISRPRIWAATTDIHVDIVRDPRSRLTVMAKLLAHVKGMLERGSPSEMLEDGKDPTPLDLSDSQRWAATSDSNPHAR